MIPQKIQALISFIDFLDENKKEYIDKYIPLCDELKSLHKQRENLNPQSNYTDKLEYDKIQSKLTEKFKPITQNIYNPITKILKDLDIWCGEKTYSSIWNSNYHAIYDFKQNFEIEDISQIMDAKRKYLDFRRETNTDFLSLMLVFHNLDELLKELFDFFKDTDENEFDSFEIKNIKVSSISEALKKYNDNPTENFKFTIPMTSSFDRPIGRESKNSTTNLKNELIMGDKFQVGDISNINGQVTIGNENKVNIPDEVDLTQKSFNWQKIGIIIASVLAIITISLMIIFHN